MNTTSTTSASTNTSNGNPLTTLLDGQGWPLLLFTLAGGLLRWFRIGEQSLWLDEFFSLFLAQQSLPDIVAGTSQDILPPLYYFLLHFILQISTSPTAVRLLSWFAATLTIPLFYLLAHKLFNRRVALTATLILTIAPFQIVFAQEGRMYTLLGFFTLLMSYCFWHAWRTDNRYYWAGFVLTAVLALYTHSLAFLNILALDLFILCQPNWHRRWRPLLLTHLTIGLAFAPWSIVILQQTGRLGSEFAGATQSPLALLLALYLFLFGPSLPPVLLPVALFLALTLLIFLFMSLWRLRQADRDRNPLLFALCLYFVPVGGLYLISLITPIFVERRLLPASLALYLLFGWLMNQKPRPLHALLGILMLLTMAASLTNFYTNPLVHKTPFHTAMATLATQIEPTDTVIHASDTTAHAARYYQPQLPNHYLAGDPDDVNQTNRGRAQRLIGLHATPLTTATAGAQRAWLIIALDHNIDYQQSVAAQFDSQYTRLDHQNVGGVDLILYQLTP